MKKRKVKDEPIILDADFHTELLQKIHHLALPYKVNMLKLQQRDRALLAFIVLTGLRVSEIELVRQKQVRIYDTHILLTNVQTLKNGETREEIILPKTGFLSGYTKLFSDWYNRLERKATNPLFPVCDGNGKFYYSKPLSRKRIYHIIRQGTNMFPHWFRGVCETTYGKKIFKNDIYALQKFMGIKNIQNLTPYVQSQWKQYEHNIYSQT